MMNLENYIEQNIEKLNKTDKKLIADLLMKDKAFLLDCS